MSHRWLGEDHCELSHWLLAKLRQRRPSWSLWENITKFQRTQNVLARIVKQSGGVTQSLKYLHWLPIKWRIDFKIVVTTYKLITTVKPHYLSSRIVRYRHTKRRSLWNVDVTDNSRRLAVHLTKTIIGTLAFWPASPGIWNKLPDDVVKSSSLSSFRNKLNHTTLG